MSSNLDTPTTRTTTYNRAFLLLVVLLGVCGQLASANTFGIQNSEYPLFATSTVNCDEMLALHRWEGNCCSLNITNGDGCVLNVFDGYCKVTGQIWTLEYNSTSDASCPPSEYTSEQMGMKVINGAEGASSSASQRFSFATAAAAAIVGVAAGAMVMTVVVA